VNGRLRHHDTTANVVSKPAETLTELVQRNRIVAE
jgi:hypothetical protein